MVMAVILLVRKNLDGNVLVLLASYLIAIDYVETPKEKQLILLVQRPAMMVMR
jgi:hypothetical protein